MTLQERLDANKSAREQNPSPLLAGMELLNINNGERITLLSPNQLHSFAEHTFQVNEQSSDFASLMESIQIHGIQSPVLIRPHPKMMGQYEIISGHRRHCIAIKLEINEIPCIIHPCDDDTATQLMGITNIQRPDWLPSEKAKTYRAHLLATQRKTGITERMRTDLTAPTKSAQSDSHSNKVRTDDISAKIWGISGDTLRIYIKLNDLLPNLMRYTDEGRVVVKGAYQLAFLSVEQQEIIATVLQRYEQKKLSASKAKELRSDSEDGELNEDYVLRALGINGGKTPRDKELPINIRFTSTSLLCNTSVKKALNDPLVLEDIENILIAFAEKHNLPLK